VTELSFSEIRDIYCMRIKIAECIGQMNPKKSDEKMKISAHELQQRGSLLTLQFNIVDYWLVNHDLHNLIAGIIGNSALKQIWDHFYFLVARIWYEFARTDPENIADTLLSETTEVASALSKGNAVVLGLVQSNYISYGLARLEKQYLELNPK
jgi:DNA-binding GntR family transcriptional regulator